MKISIVIPVYNAEYFILKAVESAIQQPEVAEIILVEDSSFDNSLGVCKEIEKKYKKVRLLQHKDKKNHGAGASRNLGINKAKYNYIGFLDADDFYLKNRFKVSKNIFKSSNNIDGVYEAVGTNFYNKNSQIKWLFSNLKKLTTLNEKIDPKQLSKTLIKGKKGSLHLDGIVVKKSLILKSGMFNEKLIMHQDSDLIIKMSVIGKLVPGNLKDPVAIRNIHDNNRILKINDINNSKFLMWQSLAYWWHENKLKKISFILILKNYFYYAILLAFKKNGNFNIKKNKIRLLISELIKFHVQSLISLILILFSVLNYQKKIIKKKYEIRG